MGSSSGLKTHNCLNYRSLKDNTLGRKNVAMNVIVSSVGSIYHIAVNFSVDAVRKCHA